MNLTAIFGKQEYDYLRDRKDQEVSGKVSDRSASGHGSGSMRREDMGGGVDLCSQLANTLEPVPQRLSRVWQSARRSQPHTSHFTRQTAIASLGQSVNSTKTQHFQHEILE